MKLESQRLGELEFSEDSLIVLPRGLVGLPERKRFLLMEFGEDIPLGWMQDVDDGNFGFPVGDASLFSASYHIDVERGAVEHIGLSEVEDAVTLIVTTVASGGVLVTGNLRAPLIVNVAARQGTQLVLERPDLEMRALVDPIAFAAARRARLAKARAQESQLLPTA